RGADLGSGFEPPDIGGEAAELRRQPAAAARVLDGGLELGPGGGERRGGARLPTPAASSPQRPAFLMVASILTRLRTMPGSASSRSTSRAPNRATTAGSKPANASRKRSRLRRIVSQLSPAWNPSRESFSNSRRSSATGRPHSVSWYRGHTVCHH